MPVSCDLPGGGADRYTPITADGTEVEQQAEENHGEYGRDESVRFQRLPIPRNARFLHEPLVRFQYSQRRLRVGFAGCVQAPAFIAEILHYGPEGLGILRGAPALGAVAVGIVLARRPPGRHAGRLLLCAVAGFGLCIIGFGLSRHFWLSALFLLLSGVCDGVSVVLRTTIMQLVTPDGMRGRVAPINGIFIGSSNELGAFYAGSMARLLGLVPAVVLGGCVTLGVVGATAMKAPQLRRLDLRRL